MSLTGILSRHPPPVDTSVGGIVPPSTSAPGIVMYGGGPASPQRPETVRTGVGTGLWRAAAAGGGGGDDDSSSDHS